MTAESFVFSLSFTTNRGVTMRTVKQFAPRTKPETIRADIDALLPAAVR